MGTLIGVIIGILFGVIISRIFAPTSNSRFSNDEIVVITQKIDSVKAKDHHTGSAIMAEWKLFVSNDRSKLSKTSHELFMIIQEVIVPNKVSK